MIGLGWGIKLQSMYHYNLLRWITKVRGPIKNAGLYTTSVWKANLVVYYFEK